VVQEKLGPLLMFEDRRPLTRARFGEQVREAATKAGLDCFPFSSHSFCIGAATTAASRGINDATIKMAGKMEE